MSADESREGKEDILDDSIFHQGLFGGKAEDCSIVPFVFQFPSVLSLVVDQLWVVVPSIKVFKDSREDLWLLIRKVDSSCIVLEELALAGSFEEG